MSDVDEICETFEGNDSGDEPSSTGTGPSDVRHAHSSLRRPRLRSACAEGESNRTVLPVLGFGHHRGVSWLRRRGDGARLLYLYPLLLNCICFRSFPKFWSSGNGNEIPESTSRVCLWGYDGSRKKWHSTRDGVGHPRGTFTRPLRSLADHACPCSACLSETCLRPWATQPGRDPETGMAKNRRNGRCKEADEVATR